MSTSGSFTPPGGSCYEPRMTRAQAVARMFAGTLNPNCVVIITDGPVIGTAGNTSPTEIEMQPVTASDIGRAALVHTTFSAQAWAGTYDLNTGTIHSLTDDWLNFAVDEDAGAPTVHTQVPWHRGSDEFAGNNFDTVVLPGWDIAVGELTDNDIAGSTVDLTGMTTFAGGQFRRNRISNSSVVTIVSDQTTITENVISNSQVNCQSGAQFGMLGNTLANASIFTVDATTTGRVALSDSSLSRNYRLAVIGYTGPNPGCIIGGNLMVGKAIGVDDMVLSGPAQINILGNGIYAGELRINGAGTVLIEGNDLRGSNIIKNAASSAPLTIQLCECRVLNLVIGAANAGANNAFVSCDIRNVSATFNGPVAGAGLNAFVSAQMSNLTLVTAATATAGIAVNNGTLNGGTITQNRTAGAASLHLVDCSMLGAACAVTDNGGLNPVNQISLQGVELLESSVTFGDVGARTVDPIIYRVSMVDSALNVNGLPGAQSVRNGRMLAATLNNAGFDINVFTIDGLTKTLGANQSNRAGSVAFDNYS